MRKNDELAASERERVKPLGPAQANGQPPSPVIADMRWQNRHDGAPGTAFSCVAGWG